MTLPVLEWALILTGWRMGRWGSDGRRGFFGKVGLEGKGEVSTERTVVSCSDSRSGSIVGFECERLTFAWIQPLDRHSAGQQTTPKG